MLTIKFFGGRLAEVMQTVATLFHLAYAKKMTIDDIVLDCEYIGKDFLNESYNVFMDNFPIFYKIKKCFRFGLDYNQFIDIDISRDWKRYYIDKDNSLYKNNNIRIVNGWFDFIVNTNIYRNLYYQKNLWDKYRNKYRNLYKNKTLGIHLRLKDFILLKKHPELYKESKGRDLIDIDFLNKKIHEINNLTENLFQIIVFSDDIQYAKENIEKFNNLTFMEGNKPYEDMILISLCDNLIRTKGTTFSKMALSLKP